MEVCAATFSGSLYPSEWRVTMPLRAHVDLPESVHPMCWCTRGVEMAVWASCCEVSSRVGAVLGRASHTPGAIGTWCRGPQCRGLIELTLMLQGPQDKLSCMGLGCPPAARGKPWIWIFEIHWAGWCDAQKYQLGLFHGLQQGFQTLLWVQKG